MIYDIPVDVDRDSSLLVADGQCPRIRQLLKAAESPVFWLMGPDPLAVVSEALAQRRRQGQPVHTLHWLSHGSPGALELSAQRLDRAALLARLDQLADWQVDTIALWACDTGRDLSFLSLLEEATAAQVWASPVRLGRTGPGTHNWQLQSNTGGVNPHLPVATERLRFWPHQLNGANNPPVLADAGSTLHYTEGDGPAVIDASLSLSDVDDTNIESATASITSGYVATEDVLTFADANGITGSWNAPTGVLTLTGTATKAQYEQALESITYVNTNTGDPSVSVRTVEWIVNDGVANSNAIFSSITVTPTTDNPVVTATGTAVAFNENDAPVTIDSNLTITDADDTHLAGATVTISSNLRTGDVLAVAGTAIGNLVSGTSITVSSYNSSTGVLTLSGPDTIANYQAVLRSVTFSNTSGNPNGNSSANPLARTITFAVTDANSDRTDTLLSYPFNNNSDRGGLETVAFKSDILLNAALSGGSGLGLFSVGTDSWSGSVQVLKTAPGSAITAANASDAVANNWYFEFTLTPEAGASLDIRSIEADWSRGGTTATRGWFVRASTDGFASDLYTNETPVGSPTGLQQASFNLNGFTGLTAPVSFRFYIYTDSMGRYMDFQNVRFSDAEINAAVGTGSSTRTINVRAALAPASSGSAQEPAPAQLIDNTPTDPAPGGTNFQPTDADGDGLREVVTAADGTSVDGNRDGIPDADQSQVAGLRLINDGARGSDFGAISVAEGIQLQAVTLTEPATDGSIPVTARGGGTVVTSTPAGITNVFAGVISFTAAGVTPGGTTQATISLPTGLGHSALGGGSGTAYLRFNYDTNRFEDFVDVSGNTLYTFVDSDGDGNIDAVNLTLTDGDSRWDGDGVANGVVVDPGFLAIGLRDIVGTKRKDALTGNLLANVIRGRMGNDRLWGGLGADHITGGQDRDRILYTAADESTPSQSDTVFFGMSDRFIFKSFDGDALTEGQQSLRYIGKKGFSGSAGELRYSGSGLLADTTGDGQADFAVSFAKATPWFSEANLTI